MTLQKLASLIAKREGKKSQARIGDIREILGIIADILVEGELEEFYKTFNDAGVKRAKKRTPKAAKGKR